MLQLEAAASKTQQLVKWRAHLVALTKNSTTLCNGHCQLGMPSHLEPKCTSSSRVISECKPCTSGNLPVSGGGKSVVTITASTGCLSTLSFGLPVEIVICPVLSPHYQTLELASTMTGTCRIAPP
jgi:hypothetical protein